MKHFITAILILTAFGGQSQTFSGIRAGLYKGELDEYQKGEVDVWIEINQDALTFAYKTRVDQKPSIFTISDATENYVFGRSSGMNFLYLLKENQLFTWTEKTISAYGVGYSLLKDRLRKIYDLQSINSDLEMIALIVSDLK